MQIYADGGHSSRGVTAAAWASDTNWHVTAWRSRPDDDGTVAELTAATNALRTYGQRGVILHVDHDLLIASPGHTRGQRFTQIRRKAHRRNETTNGLYEVAFGLIEGFDAELVQVPGHADTTPERLRLCDRLERWARWQLLGDAELVTVDIDDTDAAEYGLDDDTLDKWDKKDWAPRAARRTAR